MRKFWLIATPTTTTRHAGPPERYPPPAANTVRAAPLTQGNGLRMSQRFDSVSGVIDWLQGGDRRVFTSPEWLRGFAHRLREVDASGLTAQQLETLVLEIDLHFGVSASGSAFDEPSGVPGDIQSAFDRMADAAEATAGELERARKLSAGEHTMSHGLTIALLAVGVVLVIGGVLLSGMAAGWAGVFAAVGGVAIGAGLSRVWRSAVQRRREREGRADETGQPRNLDP